MITKELKDKIYAVVTEAVPNEAYLAAMNAGEAIDNDRERLGVELYSHTVELGNRRKLVHWAVNQLVTAVERLQQEMDRAHV